MTLDAIDLTKSALIVVDLQNGFCHKDGTLGQSGLDTDHLRSVIQPLRKVIERCREVDMPVLWTLQEHFERDARRERKSLQPHTAKRKGVVAVAGSWDAAIVDELADLADIPSHIVRKHRFGGFYETRMNILLEMLGVEAVFVTGLTTNACVETNDSGSRIWRDFDVIAIEDCVAGVRPAWEATAKEVWQQYFGITASSEGFSRMGPTGRCSHVAVGVHHLLLMVNDLERSQALLHRHAGFRSAPRRKTTTRWQTIHSVSSRIWGSPRAAPATASKWITLRSEVRNVVALNKKLKEAGIEFERELGDGPYGQAIYVRDPDGNVLELFET